MTDSTIHAQRAVIARFNAAAKKYRSTYADHRNDPCNGEVLEAWDKATAEFSAMIANDELNIIAALLEALTAAEKRQLTAAATDVLAERQRQQSVEGWTPEHDDEHSGGEIAFAAASYTLHAHGKPIAPDIPFFWPWEPKGFKQQGARRDLVKAGALILAEIERIDRAAGVKWEDA